MGEVQKEDESPRTPIDIFVCYAHKDEEYRQRLENHLSIFQREGLIRIWHDGNISAGEEWEQIIHTQLDTAQIVLLLVSPDFIASDYCYSVEMKKALERHVQREAHVIPVIVRPIRWDKTPLGKLQALPKNAKPIALWRNRDAAFFDVEEGILRVIEEVKAQSLLSPPSYQPQEKGKKSLQKASVMGKASLLEALVVRHKSRQAVTASISSEGLSQALTPYPPTSIKDNSSSLEKHISPPRSKNSRKRRLFIFSTAILLILAVSLVPLLPLPTCSFTICPSSPQSIKQPSPRYEGKVQNQDLSVELVAVVSPSFVLPDDPKHYSAGITPPRSISAALLQKNTSPDVTIIINVQNLRDGGTDILIDYIALKLLSIPALPRPLRVWTPGVTTTYLGYPYPVTYKGQRPGQLVYTKPAKHVILAPAGPNHAGESDPLSLQIMSTVTAYLRFQMEITYQITDTPQTLILPQIFQVVFSDASNWQEEIF